MIDGSESIKSLPADVKSQYKEFIKSIYNFYNVSQYGANVGVVVYSSNATTEFKFDRYYNKSDINAAINGIVFPGQSTRTGSGLTAVLNDLFANSRRGIPNFLVAATDGVSTDGITQPSAFLRAMNVYILAVGIGDFYARPQLEDMASDPDRSYVFEASTYDTLSTTAIAVKERICKGSLIIIVSVTDGYWLTCLKIQKLLCSLCKERVVYNLEHFFFSSRFSSLRRN